MAPKAPPKPPPPKNIFERFGDQLDSDQGKKITKILVTIFFFLAVLMYYLYKTELDKGEGLKKAVASIREFAVEYDTSLLGKTDLEILAAVHVMTLHLLNWTLKNEELEKELKILTEMLPDWQAFEKNLYFFSDIRKNWDEAHADCLSRHTADLVSCRYGEEQGYIDKVANKTDREFWLGLRKKEGAANNLQWLAGYGGGVTYWDTSNGQPNHPGNPEKEPCISSGGNCRIKSCWHDNECEEQKYFCCKMMPVDEWFY